MSDETKQAVVDTTDTAAKPAVTDDSARNNADDLESLLAEFDQATTRPAVSPPDTKTAPQPDPVAERLNALERQIQGDKERKALDQTIKEIRGDIPEELFDDVEVEAWLDAQARRDPRLNQMWNQREVNPRQWAKVQAELAKRLQSKLDKLPDKAATEDRAAVTASLRGASTKVAAEPAPNYARQSNAEFRKAVLDQHGFDPGV